MQNSSPMSARPDPWYCHRWPWLLMVGPVTVLIAGAITMWISFSGADALVVDDYYKQGKAINLDLRRDRMAASLGLSLTLRFDAATGTLRGRVRGASDTTTMSLSLVHPTLPAKDRRLVAVSDSQGNFSVVLPMLERALWQVQLQDAAHTWRLHGNWAWPQQKSVDIQSVQGVDRNAREGG
jgi:hypothetical protein